MKLRPYQDLALSGVRQQIANRPIMVLPTGAGKTVVAARLIAEWDGPVLFAAHRRELIAQCRARLASIGVESGAILAGERPTNARVQVGSVQTLARRDRPAASLLIVDECHHAVGNQYRALVDAYPEAKVVGLTATPFRLDGRGLGEIFGAIVVGAYADDLIAEGSLVNPRIFSHPSPDVSGVKTTAGDFNVGGLSTAVNKPVLIGDIVEHWRKFEPLRTIVYAVDVQHSQAIVRQFMNANVMAEHVDGTTAPGIRDAIFERVRKGCTRVVSNCMVATEGIDIPELDCEIVARPTKSVCLHLQMIGRIMRPHPEKACAILLDHAGNIARLRILPTTRIEYSLDGIAKTKGVALIKTCPQCWAIVPAGAGECPECGHIFGVAEEKPTPVPLEGELTEDFGPPPWSEQDEAWREIETLRQQYDYAEGWSAHRFKARFGFWPTVICPERRLCDPGSRSDRGRVFADLLRFAIERGFKLGWAAHQYRSKFTVWPRFSAAEKEEYGIAGLEYAAAQAECNRIDDARPVGRGGDA